jgi:hypothetical protein
MPPKANSRTTIHGVVELVAGRPDAAFAFRNSRVLGVRHFIGPE